MLCVIWGHQYQLGLKLEFDFPVHQICCTLWRWLVSSVHSDIVVLTSLANSKSPFQEVKGMSVTFEASKALLCSAAVTCLLICNFSRNFQNVSFTTVRLKKRA